MIDEKLFGDREKDDDQMGEVRVPSLPLASAPLTMADPALVGLLAAANLTVYSAGDQWLVMDRASSQIMGQGIVPEEAARNGLAELRRRYDAMGEALGARATGQ